VGSTWMSDNQAIVLVTGDRYWKDYQFILNVIRDWHDGLGIRLLVHGACWGADNLCDRAATEIGIPTDPNPAPWESMGLQAGPWRNRNMIHAWPEIETVLAFHDHIKTSTGTKDMIKVALNLGKQVVLHSHSGVEFL
jgi:hypothetical protein